MARQIAFRDRLSSCSMLVSIGALGLVLMGFAGTAAKAAEFDAAKHFKGKLIRLVVDFKPGGGTDIQARYFAAHWGKFIPGNPRFGVTNLFPNPSGRNYVWKAKPDGLTLSFLASAGTGREMVDPQSKFVTAEFTQIGSHAKRDQVLLVRGTVPYNSIPESRGGKVMISRFILRSRHCCKCQAIQSTCQLGRYGSPGVIVWKLFSTKLDRRCRRSAFSWDCLVVIVLIFP